MATDITGDAATGLNVIDDGWTTAPVAAFKATNDEVLQVTENIDSSITIEPMLREGRAVTDKEYGIKDACPSATELMAGIADGLVCKAMRRQHPSFTFGIICDLTSDQGIAFDITSSEKQ
jgi:hypothetical protein